ncbi:MAG: VWA domain-containing protein [Bacteroidota bacterium]
MEKPMRTSKDTVRPGGPTSKRVSRVYPLVDTSDSMNIDGKIGELNNCMRESVPHIRKIGEDNPVAEIQMSVLQFDTTAKWIHKDVPVNDFSWTDLRANPDGVTNMGEAFNLLAMEMESSMPERGYPPLIILVTDGQATDSYKESLDKFLMTNWGKKSIRHAIAIGKDADHSVLNKFINNSEIKPIQVNNPEQLAKAIRFVSTVALKKVSSPKGGPATSPDDPPASGPTVPGTDVW